MSSETPENPETPEDSKSLEDQIKEARKILHERTSLDPEDIAKRAKKLSDASQVDLARRLYKDAVERGGGRAEWLGWAQKEAVCTYHDPDLAIEDRLNSAIEMLKGLIGHATNALPPAASIKARQDAAEADAETRALLGAVYKRFHQFDGRLEHLIDSLDHYSSPIGAEDTDRGQAAVDRIMTRNGYLALNAAFIADQLAVLYWKRKRKGEGEGKKGEKVIREFGATSQGYIDKAARWRDLVVEGIKRKTPEEMESDPWLSTTLVEALVGQGTRESLEDAASKFKGKLPAEWNNQTAARQLARVVQLQAELRESPNYPGHGDRETLEKLGWDVVQSIVGGDVAAVESVRLGRVGLALSGGGFRASLFHLGVLARLAELDVLRHIEVISCVSGGSIVGAHYYLALRRKLATCPDKQMDVNAYIDVVRATMRSFVRGVKHNMRLKVFEDPKFNYRMLTEEGYSRTTRLGELYESLLFSELNKEKDALNGPSTPRPSSSKQATDWPASQGELSKLESAAEPIVSTGSIPLQSIQIKPHGSGDDFSPRTENWKRYAKVPALVLNATTMNTGHNWQFTTSWMGEPPASILEGVDGNYRLRRMYYKQLSGNRNKLENISLGEAVGASSCVPLLLEPLEIDGLYPHKRVQLVDGGVHDNQGLASLLDQNCDVIIASDASGQSDSADSPGKDLLSMNGNITSKLMSRVRLAQYQELERLKRAGVLKNLTFLHMKLGFPSIPIDWEPCDDPKEQEHRDRNNAQAQGTTEYGIGLEVQEALAGLRTDLDAFTDIESYCLMASGYEMTDKYFVHFDEKRTERNEDVAKGEWPFSRALEIARDPTSTGYEEVVKHLELGSRLFGKPWKQPGQPERYWGAWALVITSVILFCLFPVESLRMGTRLVVFPFALIVVIGGAYFYLRNRRRKNLVEVTISLLMATVGWVGAKWMLHYVNQPFLDRGEVPRGAKRTASTP